MFSVIQDLVKNIKACALDFCRDNCISFRDLDSEETISNSILKNVRKGFEKPLRDFKADIDKKNEKVELSACSVQLKRKRYPSGKKGRSVCEAKIRPIQGERWRETAELQRR